MMLTKVFPILLAFLISGTGLAKPEQVLLIDEGLQKVMLYHFGEDKVVWSYSGTFGGARKMRDMQIIGDYRVGISIAKGYVELDLNSGKLLKRVDQYSGVESFHRLENGHTLIAGNDDGIFITELDTHDQPLRTVEFPDLGPLRLLRPTSQGTFLVGSDTEVHEVNWAGESIWSMAPEGDGHHIYQIVEVEDDQIAFSTGYGASIQIVGRDHALVASLGGKAQEDKEQIKPNFFAGFDRLPNGNYLVTNWQGHGPWNGGKGKQLVEYNLSGEVVWAWQQSRWQVSSLHGVLVLDGLDLSIRN